jgi:multiple antibiotic resistance protein
MSEYFVPWSTLFSLLFMSMGPIHAAAVFSSFGGDDDDPAVRALANRSLKLVAIAFTVAVLIGDELLSMWGVRLPALIAAAGTLLIALSIHSVLSPGHSIAKCTSIAGIRATQVVFPGLLPPIAIALPIIFAAAAPGTASKIIVLVLGTIILAMNLGALRYSKRIVATIGRTPLELIGAIFAVLQTALGVQLVIDAWKML